MEVWRREGTWLKPHRELGAGWGFCPQIQPQVFLHTLYPPSWYGVDEHPDVSVGKDCGNFHGNRQEAQQVKSSLRSPTFSG